MNGPIGLFSAGQGTFNLPGKLVGSFLIVVLDSSTINLLYQSRICLENKTSTKKSTARVVRPSCNCKRRRIEQLFNACKVRNLRREKAINSQIRGSCYRALDTLAPFHVGLVMFRSPASHILDVGHLGQKAVAVVEPSCHRRSRHVLLVARPVPHAGDDHVLQGV